MSRKLLIHRRQVDGLEAPRNSLELPIGTLQTNCAMDDNIPYSYQVKQKSSKDSGYRSETSMKKLIDKEISKRPENRRNVPSVVARLMGMDTLPLDTKSAIHAKEKKKENALRNFPRKEQTGYSSVGRSPLGSILYQQTELYVPSHGERKDPNPTISGVKYGKPRSREHPQEEELQKFKKEFEAWQAARVWECAKVVEVDSISRQWLAQENLNKEKMAVYADSRKMTLKGHISLSKVNASLQERDVMIKSSEERGGLQDKLYKKVQFEANHKESGALRRRTKSCDFEKVSLINCDQIQGKSAAPTRIVILKPGLDKNLDSEETWAGSSEIVEEDGSIEDLLEEVKERLRGEILGKKAINDFGISEQASNPKEIARHIAKQVRESVTRDLGLNLLRSESTRSYRSDSPEFINRDTRKVLAERLKNVIKRETHGDIPVIVRDSSRASSLDNHKCRPRPIGDVLKNGNWRDNWGSVKGEHEIQTGSFRHGQNNGKIVHLDELSPRNLRRSLSAPVSGTSFGKLLLEDRHVLTGAHIRRKHEATENVSLEVIKNRKERFNFRGKVSNFRYSFSLKGKLFGRKIQSVNDESGSYEYDPMKDIMSGPTVVMNPGISHENSTEVPPSPASVCSSGHEEHYRTTDHSSPISILDAPVIEDHTVREISSNLHELRRQFKQLEFDRTEETSIEESTLEPEMVYLEDESEAYIRDLLIASGLYNGSYDWSISRWDPLAKPISRSVFEEVENSYTKIPKENEESTMEDQNESKVIIHHKVLFDLLNEVVSTLIGPPMAMPPFKRKVLGPTTDPPPRGKKLFDNVWAKLRPYVYPSTDVSYSLDTMVARELGITPSPWSGMMHDDVDTMGREIEWRILEDLIEECVRDLLL